MTQLSCSKCHKGIVSRVEGSTGYGTDDKGHVICLDCCAAADLQYMRDNGRITLYLAFGESRPQKHIGTRRDGDNLTGKVGNWSGGLSFPTTYIKKGKHNWGLTRYDVWFVFEGFYWHGYKLGDNTDICHCRKTKAAVKAAA